MVALLPELVTRNIMNERLLHSGSAGSVIQRYQLEAVPSNLMTAEKANYSIASFIFTVLII